MCISKVLKLSVERSATNGAYPSSHLIAITDLVPFSIILMNEDNMQNNFYMYLEILVKRKKQYISLKSWTWMEMVHAYRRRRVFEDRSWITKHTICFSRHHKHCGYIFIWTITKKEKEIYINVLYINVFNPLKQDSMWLPMFQRAIRSLQGMKGIKR